jgi:Arsenical pump membrane protein
LGGVRRRRGASGAGDGSAAHRAGGGRPGRGGAVPGVRAVPGHRRPGSCHQRSRQGLSPLIAAGDGLPVLLAKAALAAVLSNVINNLPAVLVLLPLAAAAGAGPVLAVLLGVNIGPNLTYAGSLATLLWRRVMRCRVQVEAQPRGHGPPARPTGHHPGTAPRSPP